MPGGGGSGFRREAPGPIPAYGVGGGCILCNACADAVPSIFGRDPGGRVAALRAPATASESRACEEAMELCPTGAISPLLDPPAGSA